MAMYEITGKILLQSGLHIGGGSEFSAIGAIDSPVVRDELTNLPIIPGSSLKGKMRSLLSRKLNGGVVPIEEDGEIISRLFGSVEQMGRLIFRDSLLSNLQELLNAGANGPTEAKYENTIKRLTAEANPRQIERVIRGSVFELEIIYRTERLEEIIEDMETLRLGFKLLSYDYLGGHGTRGSGRVQFVDMDIDPLHGEEDPLPGGFFNEINELFAD